MKIVAIEDEEVGAKECPFCGSSILSVVRGTEDREGRPTQIVCEDCGANGPWFYETGGCFDKALKGWNKRA